MWDVPGKRRRLTANCKRPDMAAQRLIIVAPGPSDTPSTTHTSRVTWPKSSLPVELFTLIISYLDRMDIQNMRLVGKEFEEKVSQTLFKTVVVPFNPEIYGIKEKPLSDPLSNASLARPQANGRRAVEDDRIRSGGGVMLQDKGMRVFQGFGKYILKFAMSFELDQTALINPPMKSDQEAITTFWGIYRWPFKTYNRYSQLEGLEQTADETRTMTNALQYVSKATELGLSIDCGLGWLSGPDTNPVTMSFNRKPPVFRISKPSDLLKPRNSTADEPGTYDDERDCQILALQTMLVEAGYTGDDLQRSLNTLLQSEGMTLPPSTESVLPQSSSDQGDDQSNSSTAERRELAANMLQTFGYSATAVEAVRNFLSRRQSWLPALFEGEGEEAPETNVTVPRDLFTKTKLKPNDLTTAQKEMLLEVEWAQRAFMQSYAIAVIDNRLTFRHVQSFTIARLPSRYLTILHREDFWDSLPGIAKLSLAIIPDWRDVTKLASTYVQDVRLCPSLALEPTFILLRDRISPRKHIKELKFEWLCGGEEAVGLFARNQHILPAPFIPKYISTPNPYTPDILSLPYVEHLTLKNCWAHHCIFTSFVKSLKAGALKTLTLNSFSLTDVPFEHPEAEPGVPTHLSLPTRGSWPSVISEITPGETLEMKRFANDFGPKPLPRPSTNLERITFESCGYVNLPADFEHRHLPLHNNDPTPESNHLAKRRAEIEGFMLKPHDSALGTILNHMPHNEIVTLTTAWLLQMGYDPSSTVLGAQAKYDGISMPGEGRFRGTLEAVDEDDDD